MLQSGANSTIALHADAGVVQNASVPRVTVGDVFISLHLVVICEELNFDSLPRGCKLPHATRTVHIGSE